MIFEGSRSEKMQIYLGEADRINFDQINFSVVLKNEEFSHWSKIDLAHLLDIAALELVDRS